jgi:AcrR family transcriptional regulator
MQAAKTPGSPPRARRLRAREGTRRRILDAALACFTELGYEQTTVSLIRRRGGVSNGALFHHFASKEAIADALYVEAMASFQEGLWAVLRRRPRTLRAGIRATISHQLGWVQDNPDRARFLYVRGHLDWDSPASADLAELNRELAAAYRGWLTPLQQAGKVRPTSIVMLTAIVTGPTHAIARRWLAGHLAQTPDSHLDELTDAACAALGSPAGTPARAQASVRHGRVRLELLADDDSVLASGGATVALAPGPSA